MDFQAGLRSRLLAANAAPRVDWMTRPQNSALPAITLQVISDPRETILKGFVGARATRVQCDCWATTYAAALVIARAAIAALKDPVTVSGKKFGNAQVDSQRDLGESVADGSFIHRQSVDFIIWHVGD